MSQPVIKIENLSKIYRLGEVGTGTLSHDLNRWWRMSVLGQEDPYAKVWAVNDRTQKAHRGEWVSALRNIDLEVHQGEVLGIIGRNGAGKSTLLKILSRITSPSTGRIKVEGRMASLLEVGTGFHSDMTGRENIYLNGTIMGMRRQEIDRKLDEIVEFAGVAKYLDTPVKRYSSGMTVRLGFAIAAHLEPEILIVDEVLAVGDAEFQKKAIGKMQDVSRNDGRTVLFVSHNLKTIELLCGRAIMLDKGTIAHSGSTTNIISEYQKFLLTGQEAKRSGTKELEFTRYSISQTEIKLGESLELSFDIKRNRSVSNVSISLDIRDENNAFVAHVDNADDGFELAFNGSNTCTIRVVVKDVNLAPGSYLISLWTGTNFGEYYDFIENCIPFRVVQGFSLIKREVPYDSRGLVAFASKWTGVK
ncbi:MAG: ABC transporter ATP-binding protein [Breznakibacter sp.]